ncbi:MAG: urease accessory protein UreD [Ruegeria sp.]
MLPRANGAIRLSAKKLGPKSVLDAFRQSGSYKCLFPRTDGTALDAVLLNTAGGITGGDSFRFHGRADADTMLTLTTQACERVYRAPNGPPGKVVNHVTVDAGARLNWLPQETILYNGSALDRRLLIEMDANASVLLVEPLVFGRRAMGEVLTDIRLRDRIELRRSGKALFADALQFDGDLQAHLSKPNIADGAGAMALIVFASSTAEGQLEAVRGLLPESAGVSLIRSDLLVIRILAESSFELRKTLMPILRQLNDDNLPRCWMI